MRLSFKHKFVRDILSGEKWLTARLWEEEPWAEGDEIELVETRHYDVFAQGRIDWIETFTVEDFVQHNWEGHRNYDSCEEFIEEMEKYYADVEIDKNSEIFLIGFKILEKYPTDGTK